MVISIFSHVDCIIFNHLEMRFAESFLIMSGSVFKCDLHCHFAELLWGKPVPHQDLK